MLAFVREEKKNKASGARMLYVCKFGAHHMKQQQLRRVWYYTTIPQRKKDKDVFKVRPSEGITNENNKLESLSSESF